MDRRVFEPRPNGNDARRRNAIGMAAVVLVAAWLWLSMSHDAGRPGTTPPAPATSYAQHVSPPNR